MGKYIDESGKRYGRLSVIEYAGVSNTPAGGATFRCICDCGNEAIVKGADLRGKRVVSCGCVQRENAYLHLKSDGMIRKKDEIGNTYGKLTVLSLAYVNTSGNAHWNCVCECGTSRVVCGTCLRDGSIDACEFCSAKSRGEQRIHELLEILNVPHQAQFVMDELRGLNGRRLPFDFAVFCDNHILCLIEYQGAQHYVEVPYFHSTDSLEHRRQTDEKKRQFCRENNIRLIEIPYWDYDSLNTEYLFELLFQRGKRIYGTY